MKVVIHLLHRLDNMFISCLLFVTTVCSSCDYTNNSSTSKVSFLFNFEKGHKKGKYPKYYIFPYMKGLICIPSF